MLTGNNSPWNTGVTDTGGVKSAGDNTIEDNIDNDSGPARYDMK
ncbi:MAG: hypothetical protein QOI12_705 [Alphaproteobacteria bacterium]|jgi:hypothetical protein|nr:hypothetical protein [Alphaproteobacteria bacterium]